MKKMALVDKCTNYMSAHDHDMRDHCWTCAPYWNVVALCPTHKAKLNCPTGYCERCRRYYDMTAYERE